MKKTLLIAGLVGSVALASTFAYQGNPGETNPDCTDLERQAEVQTMFENKDYEAFQTLFEDKGPARKITSEEDFSKFADMRTAYTDGDTETGDALKAELGFGMKDGSGKGQGKGQWKGMRGGDCDGTGEGSAKGWSKGKGQGRNR